ncbi:hypothetical protein EDC04DRAFT_2576252, partial [Pisolithus marmoratus]
PIRFNRFDIYHHMYVETGSSIFTGHGQGFQKIHASPNIVARGHKNETPARFDTMFILEEDNTHTDTIILNNMQPAQVHIIFKLPEHLGTYPHLLVYVEWVTTHQCQDPMSSLYIVSCST